MIYFFCNRCKRLFTTSDDSPPSRCFVCSLVIRLWFTFNEEGRCRICKEQKPLKMEVCYDCAHQTDGRSLGNGFHEIWDRKNKNNRWVCHE